MAEILALHFDPYLARVRRIAIWLSGRAGRTERVRSHNLSREVNGYMAALQVANTPAHMALRKAEAFRADVIARLSAIDEANMCRPAGTLIDFRTRRRQDHSITAGSYSAGLPSW